ncbi:hypothetical protein SAMN05216370_0345 [Pseudomonas peli]|uniref:Translation initiation factor 2 n=1 Tax=Pseudomonas peli TaxID=592361 RepID=A0AB37Z2M5_9PSED|nr:hypothetical protein [Pseudomonas peli]SCW31213.1 hypothetical protein SAMN05216370_0345 [Pseudomonas peli]|tara:strand:- start:8630 stop:9118 length:489 start_codon:yes stop_codon:yes gene_type:complete
MLPIRSLALLLTLLSLVACEQSATPPAKPKVETSKAQSAQTVDTSKAAKAEPAPVVSKPAQPKAAEAKPVPVKPKPVAVASKPEPTEPKAPLDLSLHPDVFDPLQPLEPLNDLSTPLLPPLFVEKTEPESPFQLNGKLITNERGDDYWQSVEGAQLQFEFKQ